MGEYEEYEAECARIRKENAGILAGFETWLEKSGLKEKTIKKHVVNIDLYINDYLLYYDTVEAKDGWDSVHGFLGDWFIRKTTWSSPTAVRENAASLKKFYKFMVEAGEIDQESLEDLKDTIKIWLDEWVETAARDWYGDSEWHDGSESASWPSDDWLL